MFFKKPLDRIYKELRADIKKFFRQREEELAQYGEASRRIGEKIRQGLDGNLDMDETSGIQLEEIWSLRDNCVKELSRLCGKDAAIEKENHKMFGQAYEYLARKLNLQ